MSLKYLKSKSNSSIYSLLIYRLILLLTTYFVFRLVFFWFNYSYYPGVSFSHFLYLSYIGIRFDLTALLYINVIYIFLQLIPFSFRYGLLYQKILKVYFILSNAIFLFFNAVDLVYFRFGFRRSNLSILSQFSNETGNVDLVTNLLADYGWAFIFLFAMLYLLSKTYGSIQLKLPSRQSWAYGFNVTSVLVLLFGLFISLFGVRFSFSDQPLSIVDAGAYVRHPLEANIILNTSFCLIWSNSEVDPIYKFYPISASSSTSTVYHPVHTPLHPPLFNNSKKNIVILILESFGKQHTGFYNKNLSYNGYTPFLDSLASRSLTFKYSYSNGVNSIDACPSLLLGIPSLLSSNYVTSKYAKNEVLSLADILSSLGYQTAFFHGAFNGSMHFESFSKQIGFNKFYGKTEFNNDLEYDGCWGIWDEPFMQFAVNQMSSYDSSFLSVLFSLSSHHPFLIPSSYSNQFQEGELPIHKSVSYVDYSLRQFFATASQQPWFNNTLFIITGDHTNGIVHPQYATSVGMFEVPILFYDPSSAITANYDQFRMVQHADIAPSILDYLAYSSPYFSFGHSIFRNTNFTVNKVLDTYQITRSGYVYCSNFENNSSLYHLETDQLMQNNLILSHPLLASEMDSLLHSFMQTYISCLSDNSTIIK